MADLYISQYQYKYYNSFNFYDGYYEFNFYYLTEPIIVNNKITAYSFKPCVEWIVFDDEINYGFITDEYGNPLSFIFTTDELKECMMYSATLLSCEYHWSDNGYYMDFKFDNYITDEVVYSRQFSFLNYDLSLFNSNEIINNPYTDHTMQVYLQDVAFELNEENGRLLEENHNLRETQLAPGSTFELFANAFKPVFDTLNIQVAPSITIGMILAVPLVAGILSFLLRETIK